MANNTAKSLSDIRFYLGAVRRALTVAEATSALEMADFAADGLAYGELPADIRAAFSRAELAIGDLVANGDRIVASNGARHMKVCG